MLGGSLTKGKFPKWLGLIAALIGLLFFFKAVEISVNPSPHQKINRGVEYLLDTENLTSIHTVMSLDPSRWRTFQKESVNLAQESDAYWLRFTLKSLSQLDVWLLEVDNPKLDEIEVWFLEDDNLLSNYRTGDNYPFRVRPIAHERFLFPIPKQEEQSITVYLKVKSVGNMRIPLHLWKQQDYLIYGGEYGLVMGVFLGFMLAMTTSNFFFFVFSRSLSFLLYSGYALSVAMLLFSLHGLSFKYFWPLSPWLQNHSIGIFASTTLMFAVLFIRQLINLKHQFYRVDLSLKAIATLFASLAVASTLIQGAQGAVWFLSIVTAVVLYLLLAGFWLWAKGLRVSPLYLFAWLTLMTSALVASLDGLNIINMELKTPYFLMLGATIETVLLALLLAQSYSQQSKELLAAQDTALQQEKQIRAAKEEVIEMQEKANEELEYKVQERTLELEVALRELAEKNKELEEKNTLDALTGIRNRRYFDKRYLAEIRRSRREQTELTVAMIDIDHFKDVNDTHGHLVGDECIKYVAQITASYLKRPSDEVCRYGGEEFAILMPNTNEEGAKVLLEKIRQHLETNPVICSTGNLSVTISVGYATGIISGDLPESEILDSADQALYDSKNAGRNQTTFKSITTERKQA